jgi:elongation factor P
MASKPIKELKPGNAYTENNELFQCISNEQMKTGRLSGNYIVKRKNMRKGGIDQTSYTPNAKVEIVNIEKSKMSFSYVEGTDYVFMNNETYDMVNIPAERLEWEKNFIVDNLEVDVTVFDGEVIGVSLPANVAMVITEAEPAVKGDTATGATKNAIVETGYQIRVPLFIESGETVLVSTENGDYKGRA